MKRSDFSTFSIRFCVNGAITFVIKASEQLIGEEKKVSEFIH